MVKTIQLSLVTSCLSAGQEYHVFRDEDIMGVIQEEKCGEMIWFMMRISCKGSGCVCFLKMLGSKKNPSKWFPQGQENPTKTDPPLITWVGELWECDLLRFDAIYHGESQNFR